VGSSFTSDPDRTWRALTAQSSVSVVAVDESDVLGIAYAITDGEITSFLSVLLVARDRRREA
jgi:hypothetical protein